MPVISRQQAQSECDALTQRVVDAARDKDRDAEIVALQACIAHPCSVHEMCLPELWSELAGAYRSAGRLDDAMKSWERAIAAGYRAVPHPRAEIAEVLLESGRRSEADTVYAELREECHDDVWLYNSAGWSYGRAGDHVEALRWLDDGIGVALAWGDPEDILDQLMEFRQASQAALGLDLADEVAARVAAFERPPGYRHAATDDFGGVEPVPLTCEHCGWEPAENELVRSSVREVKALAEALQHRPPAPASVVRQKIGRNQPCPCGSGRKYKHCHGR